MPRETLLARTFVDLADSLVADFDVVDLLTILADRCVEVLDVAAAGIMLAAPQGELRVMASSSETMRLLELFELQAQQGPCLDCYYTARPVASTGLADETRWPDFSRAATRAGFASVQALPLRLRGTVIGALNLFNTDPGAMRPADLQAGQALADVATIAILQHRAVLENQLLNAQLTSALDSRVVVEQAKGVLAERQGLDMEAAFQRLRAHARSHNLRLADIARQVITGTLNPTTLHPPETPPNRHGP